MIPITQYRWTWLYSRDRDSKNRLEYNKFAYKKTKDYCKLEDRFQKKVISGSHIREIAEKKTAYKSDKTKPYLRKVLYLIYIFYFRRQY